MKRLVILMLILKVVDEIQCGCMLLLKSDFGSPSPVFLYNGDYLVPNTRNGSVALPRSAAITVACPKRFVVLGNDTTTLEVVDAKCVSKSTFSVGTWRGELRNISCNTQPYFTAEETQEACYHGGQNKVKVGYTVRNKLHVLYTACFDRSTLSTLFVEHHLAPSSYYGQTGHRPQFTGGELFGHFPIANVYKLKYQKDRINSVLGENKDQEYLSKKQFLTRGHLAANADFPMRAQQRASFHYVNVAPQWMRGNAGDWAALEEAVRRRVRVCNASVSVFTGAHGVLALPGAQGQTELYLHTDENNNNAVPVPLYFYKLIHDPLRKTATAFVLVNSSFFNKTTTDRLTFCNDVCDAISWLKWRNDATHSFCCSYEDFVGVIDHVVNLDVEGLYV